MAVTVKFWTFAKKKNSTKVPTASPSYTFDCQIKTETTLTNPVIELNTGSATGCTYAQIGDFGRYYFITDWQFNRGLWTAYLEVDVLGTYKTQIGTQNLYVSRSASSYDGDIKDMFYPTKAGVTHQYRTISKIGTSTFNTGVYVIGVLGNNTETGGSVYYQLTPSDFASLINQLFIEASNVTWSSLAQGIINSIMNPTQYVVSCRWYPTAFDDSAYTSDLCLGLWPSGAIYGKKLTGDITVISDNVSIPKHPLASTRGDYMNLSPFTNYAFQWGSRYDLDTTLLAKATDIYYKLVPDFTQTEAFLQIYPGSTGNTNIPLVATYVPYGVDIPLAQSSVNPGALLSVASQAALTAMSGSVVAGAASAILPAAEALSPGVSSTKSGGGVAVAMSTPYLSCAFFDVADDDVADFGRPLMKTKQISTLSGYIKCECDDVSISCLDPERDRIRAYMTGGFFYE